MASISSENGDIMKCPSCMRTASIQHYPSNFPPKNFAMIQVLQHGAFETKKKADKEICFECGDCVATKYCMDCKAGLCEVCTTSLHIPRTFSTHSIVDIGAKKSPTPVCSSHGGKKMKLFCVSCSETACSLCASHGQHKGHECKLIQEVAASKRKLVESAVLQSKESEARLQDLAKSMRSSEDGLILKKAEFIRDLKKDLDTSWILAAVQNRCDFLVEELGRVAESRIQELSEHQLRNATSLARAAAVLHEANLALEADDYCFLVACKDIQDKLEETLAESESTLAAKVPPTVLTCNLGTVRIKTGVKASFRV
jgi:hypothetical protein